MPQDFNRFFLSSKNKSKLTWLLNGLMLLFAVLIGIFSYQYFNPKTDQVIPVVVQAKREPISSKPHRVIQLDVLNGCGAKGIGLSFTNLLRASGFDVVEMKNYKTFHIPQTMVVDRVGNLETAKQVARVLGVDDKNVIQQINPDYYVDVSVIIGKDYADLKISR